MAEFTVKEIARQIQTSTQYVYQQMPLLMKKSLAYRDENNKPIIYDKGLEFLLAKRKTGLQVANKGLQSDFESVEKKPEETNDSEVVTESKVFASEMYKAIEIYKKLYEEQKEEAKYWKEQFIEKDKALTELTSGLLLPPAEESAKKQKKKWGFWNR